MIHYIEDKKTRYSNIKKLLNLSKTHKKFTNGGPVKQLLERKIEELIGIPDTKRVLCVSNGTTALHALALFLEKHKSITKFISPAFTFPSCVVNKMDTDIVDIDENYTIRDVDVLDHHQAVILTNLFGTDCSKKIENKLVIYDNASSFLSKFNGVSISVYGDYSFSSLHHTKTLGFGEGGFLVVPENEYDEISSILCFGFNNNRIHNVYSSNFKMADSTAAFILDHIENYNIEKHLDIQHQFKSLLPDNVELFNYKDGVFYGNLPILFMGSADPSYFRTNGIEANKYYNPLKPLPNSMNLYDRIINLPLHQNLKSSHVKYICETIKKYDINN